MRVCFEIWVVRNEGKLYVGKLLAVQDRMAANSTLPEPRRASGLMQGAARQIIKRLSRPDAPARQFDAQAVERALRQHFAAFGQSVMPVHWFGGVVDAHANLIRFRRELTDWFASNYAMWKQARRSAAAAMLGRNADPYRYEAWRNAQREGERAIWEADGPARQASDAAWREARRKLAMGAGPLYQSGIRMHCAADIVAEVVGCVSGLDVFDDAASRELIDVWSPWLDAYEAGLLLYAVRPGAIVCVPRPSLKVVAGLLHRHDGAAVEWPGADRYWFWRGVEVPRLVIEDPQSINVATIIMEENPIVRRCMTERMSADRLLQAAGGELIADDACGKLWHCWFGGLHAIAEVENGTVGWNGSRRRYFLRVPPQLRTAREAVAWTYGMTAHEYEFVART
jgi:hypothetical protein